MKMPWGKYRDEDIEDLPSWYLKYLAEDCKDEEICITADKEWQWREKHDAHLSDLRKLLL